MRPGPRRGFRWTAENVAYAFDLWHRRHLCTPTLSEWRTAGPDHPCANTVKKQFGSWNSAIAAAGFRPRKQGESRGLEPVGGDQAVERRCWTVPAVVLAIRSWAVEHGEPPRLNDWRLATDHTPTATTVQRLFGSWNRAIELAGFQPRPSTRRLRLNSARTEDLRVCG